MKAPSFVNKHPWMTFILAATGISAIATVLAGSHATPTPAAQNKTGS
jgi:hypothetical protein